MASKRVVLRLTLIAAILISVSYTAMRSIVIQPSGLGLDIAGFWCKEVELGLAPSECISMLNSNHYIAIQSLALAVFLLVVALIVMKSEWRVAAAIIGVVTLILSGVSDPSVFIESVSWDLILFLVGSMAFAGVLRELGVFRYLAVLILRVSRYRVYLLVFFISLLSFILSAAVGEVASIVYAVMLVLELGRLAGFDVEPLVILSVLATNTGSVALPIGNPIGVYILFASRMSVSEFIRYALPLSMLCLATLYLIYIATVGGYLKRCQGSLDTRRRSIEVFVHSFYTEIYNAKARRIFLGVALLIAFIATVALNDYVSQALSNLLNTRIDPHGFLSFIPYIYIVLSMACAVPLEEVSVFIGRAVEWPSIVFFIMLFMLGHSLLHTGAVVKIAYLFTSISISALILLPILLISSATLSAVLDNLSVIVAFTPIAMILSSVVSIGRRAFFSLLYGGVFGGNYTPIGSTANIVAISMAEKRRIKISWRRWLSIALPITTAQIAVSIAWVYISTAV